MLPRVYLAIDNCFASKRWTKPDEWMSIVKDAGANYVETSADTECDPLYTPPDVLRDWTDAVLEAQQRQGVKVCNLYSGHGTYTTLGLAHTDERMREHIHRRWLEPMIDRAAELDAGLGFYCHAFPQATLVDHAHYTAAVADLTARLADLAAYAASRGLPSVSVEQMYVPHQIPWTISGAETLLRTIFERGSTPMYITLDTGHHVGQKRYLRPTASDILRYTEAEAQGSAPPDIWLGYCDLSSAPDTIAAYIESHSYLFAELSDSDVYAWIRALGAYSPILHLQQTDGTASAHRPFTERYNGTGMIDPLKVLSALGAAYRSVPDGVMPPIVENVYLTLEIFSGTAERPNDILQNIRESVAYWRRFIPEDGLTLDQILS